MRSVEEVLAVRSRSLFRLALCALILAALADSCRKKDDDCPGVPSVDTSGPASVVRGPQVAQVEPTSIVIAWLSQKPAAAAVEYSTDMSFSSTAMDPANGEEHVISIEGLLPDTLYHYRILLDGAVVSPGHMFRTAPAAASAPFRFAAFGDSGSGSNNQLQVAARVLDADPALVIIAGDVIYEAGCPGELDPHYFEPYADLIDHIPFYPVLGNHDIRTQNGAALLGALYLPVNDQDGTERYYSFDYSNCHFVALDSSSSLQAGSPQGDWLERDLASSSAAWTIVTLHHSPYSSSHHGSIQSVRQDLVPLMDQHGVDLVLSAHDHNYERTFPLFDSGVVDMGSEPSYTDPGGTIYIVTGAGGRSLYPSGTSDFTAFSASTFHFTRVDVNGLDLTLMAIRADGSLLDEMTIHKTN